MKLCQQCGVENLPNAKFCGECGQKFAPPANRDTAIDSETLTDGDVSNKQPLDFRESLEQFTSSLSADEASSRLEKSIGESRYRLKAMGAAIPKATNPLISSLMDSLKSLAPADVGARIAIVTALGRTGDPAILPPLLLVTGARSKDVRKAVAIALGTLKHPLAAYLLLPMLTDASSRVKQAAFQALIQQNQPHTAEAILAACLCSKTLRNVIYDTLKRIPDGKRSRFFQLMSEATVDRDAGLKTVADWLRHEFRNEIARSNAANIPQPQPGFSGGGTVANDRPVQNPNHPTGVSTPQPFRRIEPTPRQLNGPATSGGDAQLAAHFAAHFAATFAAENAEAEDEDDSHLDLSSESLADISFFNSMVGNFESSSSSNYNIPLQEASNDSQANMSLSGLLAAPQFSQLSNFETDRPQFSPFAQQGARYGDPNSVNNSNPYLTAAGQQPGSNYAANTPGQSVPTMPMMHPSQMTPPFQMPMMHPSQQQMMPGQGVMPVQYVQYPQGNMPVHMNMTASSPFISTLPPAISGTQQSESSVIATTGSSVHAPVTASTTSLESATGAIAAVPLEPTEEEKAEAEKVREAKEAKERSIVRLTEARDVAFRKLVQGGEEIPNTSLPRLLTKRISKLMSTPSNNVDSVIEQIKHIGETGSPAVLSTLSSFCQKPAKVVREACAIAMGNINHPGSAVLLLKLLADKSGTVAEAAIKSLAKIDIELTRPVLMASGLCSSSLRSIVTAGVEDAPDEKKPEWEKFLLSILQSRDSEAAAFAASLLPRITGDTHVEIYQKLASSDSPHLRAAAVEALARTESKRSISHINEAMEDVSPLVRAQAALAVATMHSPRSLELLQVLSIDKDLTVRRNAAQSMSRIDEESLSGVIAKALDQETDSTTVEYLLAALQRNGAAGSLPILQRYIEGEGGQFREQAVKALRKLKIQSSIPIFRRLLDDHSATLRRQSIEQLAALKAEGSLPRIQELLKSDPDETVRAACAKALGDLADETSMHLLEEAIEDHSLVRLQAVIALGRLGKPSAGPVLLGLLRDATPEIRYQAVRAIGQLKLEGVEEQIAPLLEDSDQMVRHGAEQAFQDLGQSIGSIRSKRARRRFVSFASMLAPSSIAGLIPGGAKSLLVTVVLLVGIGVAFSVLQLRHAVGGEDFNLGKVGDVSLSGDSMVVAVLRRTSVLDLWSVKEGKLQDRCIVPKGTTGVTIEKNGGVILFSSNELRKLDQAKIEEQENAPVLKFDQPIADSSYNSAKNAIFLFFRDGNKMKLRKIDCETFKQVQEYPFAATYNGRCIVSPDETMAVMVNNDGDMTIGNLQNGEIFNASISKMTRKNKTGAVGAIAFSRDMKFIAISAAEIGVVVLATDGMSFVKSIQRPGVANYTSIVFQKDSHDLIAVSNGGTVASMSNEFETESTVEIPGTPAAGIIDVGMDGDTVAIANEEEKSVWLVSAKQKSVIHELSVEDQ